MFTATVTMFDFSATLYAEASRQEPSGGKAQFGMIAASISLSAPDNAKQKLIDGMFELFMGSDYQSHPLYVPISDLASFVPTISAFSVQVSGTASLLAGGAVASVHMEFSGGAFAIDPIDVVLDANTKDLASPSTIMKMAKKFTQKEAAKLFDMVSNFRADIGASVAPNGVTVSVNIPGVGEYVVGTATANLNGAITTSITGDVVTFRYTITGSISIATTQFCPSFGSEFVDALTSSSAATCFTLVDYSDAVSYTGTLSVDLTPGPVNFCDELNLQDVKLDFTYPSSYQWHEGTCTDTYACDEYYTDNCFCNYDSSNTCSCSAYYADSGGLVCPPGCTYTAGYYDFTYSTVSTPTLKEVIEAAPGLSCTINPSIG